MLCPQKLLMLLVRRAVGITYLSYEQIKEPTDAAIANVHFITLFRIYRSSRLKLHQAVVSVLEE
jgi:hypothetical protein